MSTKTKLVSIFNGDMNNTNKSKIFQFYFIYIFLTTRGISRNIDILSIRMYFGEFYHEFRMRRQKIQMLIDCRK